MIIKIKIIKIIKVFNIRSNIFTIEIIKVFNVSSNVGAATKYLITLRPACDGLRGAGGLAFSTTHGDLTDRDQLVFRPTANVNQYCPIHEIYLLAKISNT